MPKALDLHQTQFNNSLCDFIQLIFQVVPKDHPIHRSFKKYYSYYRKHVDQNKRVDFIEEFIKYMTTYIKEISICDEGLFSEDEVYYPGKPIQIFKGIDFKLVWRSLEASSDQMAQIWKSLQTMYVIGTHILKESNRLNALLKKQKEIVANMMQTLRLEQKIKADAERLNEKERQKAAESGFNLDSLKDLFGENNLILEMAKEIAMEMNLGNEQLSNPIEAIKLLFGQDGTKLQEIIEKVSKKLADKIESGQIDEKSLVADAEKMNANITSKFKNIPGMPDLNKFSKKVASQIDEAMKAKREQAQNDPNAPPSMPSFAELAETLKANMTEMGVELDDMDKFFEQILPNESGALPDDAELEQQLKKMKEEIA